jgi:hypothetical protein
MTLPLATGNTRVTSGGPPRSKRHITLRRPARPTRVNRPISGLTSSYSTDLLRWPSPSPAQPGHASPPARSRPPPDRPASSNVRDPTPGRPLKGSTSRIGREDRYDIRLDHATCPRRPLYDQAAPQAYDPHHGRVERGFGNAVARLRRDAHQEAVEGGGECAGICIGGQFDRHFQVRERGGRRTPPVSTTINRL